MRIVVAAFDQSLPSGVVGLMDVFWLADMALAASDKTTRRPRLTVTTASPNGKPILDGRGRRLKVDAAFADIASCDAIVIPGFVPDEKGRPPITPAVREGARWIRARHARGALACGSCSGVFVLGEAGLLNGRRCTTTWWLHDQLKTAFPLADLAWGSSLVEDKRVVSAGGPLSWIDLALHVIRTLAGAEAARIAADFAVVDAMPMSQSVYVPQGYVSATDPFLKEAEHAVRYSQDKGLTAQQLAQRLNTSERTLHRRLKVLCSESPKAFIARVRFETARTLLETGPRAVKDVAVKSGYRDESSFRRAFRRQCGMSPSAFREWSRQRRGVAATGRTRRTQRQKSPA